MKKLFYTLSLMLFLACNATDKPKEAVPEKAPSKTEANFDWLLGKWERQNEQEGKRTFEYWQKEDADLYRGIGFTMEAADTVWLEHLVLVKRGTHWHYEVTQKKATKSTNFQLTSIETDHFVCENVQNDFPKRSIIRGQVIN